MKEKVKVGIRKRRELDAWAIDRQLTPQHNGTLEKERKARKTHFLIAEERSKQRKKLMFLER